MKAFTLGNPNRYEPALDEAEMKSQPLEKQPGGVVFLSYADAAFTLEDGNLPRAWFDEDDDVRPGRVYGIELPDTIGRCTMRKSGFRILTRPARVFRL